MWHLSTSIRLNGRHCCVVYCRVMDISQREAEETMRAMARVEGIFAGVSSGGAVSAALRLSAEVENATIVAIICDRGDRCVIAQL